MDLAYQVLKYNTKIFKKILADAASASEDFISSKTHTTYFQSYFKEIKAATIVVENDYIDHDFLEDFSFYYVKCFKRYRRKCVRLHFFDISFTKSEFNNFLNGTKCNLKEDLLQKAYLGFIVVKPLPKTIIGRTCIKTYPSDNGRRYFPPVREYEANLFGIKLTVNSLAYQEQDNVVAACATSSLWSVFNSTGRLFQHKILSPVEISEAACSSLPLESRFFPNPGLSAAQMAQAIRAIGLEPYLITAKDQEILKSATYAYLKCKIPMLLGLSLIDTSETVPIPIGFHAVALTGFSLGENELIPFGRTDFLSIASRIDKIYSHDDQVGPFSRMTLNYDIISLGDGNSVNTILSSWQRGDKKIDNIRALPTILLIPLYNKIRITFQTIQETIIHFDSIIETFRLNGALPFKQRLEWDIYLTTVNEVKSGMLSSEKWRNKLRLQVLMKSMPRFIWRATAFCKGDYIIDLLFDATDLEQSPFLFNAIGYHEDFFKGLVYLSHQPDLPKALKNPILWRILEWFSEQKI